MATEPEIAPVVPETPDLVDAGTLDRIQLHIHPSYNPTEDTKTVYVIGGIHGNEPTGVVGATHVHDYFECNPRSPLVNAILSRANVLVVPCINPIGFSAQARSCPEKGTLVEMRNGKVWVPEDERRSLKMPKGWTDPNRFWEGNNTYAKAHLERFVSWPSFKPDLMIFNHDWAVPQSYVNYYGDFNGSVFDNVDGFECHKSGMHNIISQFYPTTNPFATPWDFFKQDPLEETTHTIGAHLYKDLNIPNFTVETYMLNPQSPMVHLQITLYLIALQVLGPVEAKTHLEEIKRS